MAIQEVFQSVNAKTIKGEALGWTTLVRYLAPSDVSGFDVCPMAGECGGFHADGSRSASPCLYSAGRGRFAEIQEARIKKTILAITQREAHLQRAAAEIYAAQGRALLHGMRVAVRLNGTSDLPADARHLAREFPGVTFYDYTKIRQATSAAPSNLHYTLSHDPLTVPESVCREHLASGGNVAVVFDIASFGGVLPRTWWGVRVISGDDHDLRFLDPRGVVVGLSAKGLAKHGARNGFAVYA